MLGTHDRVWGRDVRGKGCEEGDEIKECGARDVRKRDVRKVMRERDVGQGMQKNYKGMLERG